MAVSVDEIKKLREETGAAAADGHDVAAVENALRLARGFSGPVIVHAVTRKGYGYPPAENDQTDQMHQSRGFDPATGQPILPTESSVVTVPPVTDASSAPVASETTPTTAGESTPASSTP